MGRASAHAGNRSPPIFPTSTLGTTSLTEPTTLDLGHSDAQIPAAIPGRVRKRVGDHVVMYKNPASPKWYMQFNQNGRQHKPSLKTCDEKVARRLAKKKDAELALGVAADPQRRVPTIAQIAAKYVACLRGQNRDKKTLEIYTRDLTQFATFAADKGILRLTGVTADLLEEYQTVLQVTGPPADPRVREDRRHKTGPSDPRTLQNKMKTIRQLIKWAVRRQTIREDPAPGYRLPPKIKTKPKPYTPDELQRIIAGATPPYGDIFDFFRLTGLRNDELCWLTKDDVDADFLFIRIQAKVSPFTGESWRPKHGSGRSVPLGPAAQVIARRAFASSPGPWLFHACDTRSKQPGQYRPGRILLHLKTLLRRLGINHGKVHTFRHNYCSFLANKGVSPFIVMKYMGHGSLDIVMLYYHASDDDLLAGLVGVDFGEMLTPPKTMQSSEVVGNQSVDRPQPVA